MGRGERLKAAAQALQDGRAEVAAGMAEDLLAEMPGQPAVLLLAGIAALRLGQIPTACERLAVAAAMQPGQAQNHHHLGHALALAGRLDEAVRSFETALALAPDAVATLEALGVALARQRRFEAAADRFRQAVAIEPQRGSAWLHLGTALGLIEDYPGAIAAHRRCLELQPDNEAALVKLAWHMRKACDWQGLAEIDSRLDAYTAAAMAEGRIPLEHPWVGLIRHDDPARDLALSRERIRAKTAQLPTDAIPFTHRPWGGPERRLRIGYFCAMWYNHPGLHTLVPLLPEHDRERFEIVGYGYGRADDSSFRRRAIAGCDRFVDLEALSAVEAARQIYADGIDVLVDLTGHTEYGRTEILALRPAPVQALWLGYPGTTGADFIDYVIGDPTVLPPAAEPFYSERPVRLPEPLLVLGREPAPPGVAFTREGEGLPAGATVLCSFNNPVKLTPDLFASWLRILDAVPNAVLWLLANDAVELQLRREVLLRGADPERIVFARPIGYSLHLVRAGLADLALDTLGYNGGATTAALLWSGVPVVTAPGRHGPARLSASLLRAVGLPELIAADAAGYEDLAIELARDRPRLAGLRARLLAERWSSPLFDAAGFCRNLERAYRAMRERFVQGQPPAPIEIG